MFYHAILYHIIQFQFQLRVLFQVSIHVNSLWCDLQLKYAFQSSLTQLLHTLTTTVHSKFQSEVTFPSLLDSVRITMDWSDLSLVFQDLFPVSLKMWPFTWPVHWLLCALYLGFVQRSYSHIWELPDKESLISLFLYIKKSLKYLMNKLGVGERFMVLSDVCVSQSLKINPLPF